MSSSTAEEEKPWLTERTLIRLQAGSGAVFASFLTLHLSTSFSSHFGLETANTLLNAFRSYYQNPIIEPLVIFGSLGVHVIVGSVRIFRRWQRNGTTTAEPLTHKLNRYAGYFLGAVLGGHIVATRVVPAYLFPEKLDLSFVTLSMVTMPGVFHLYYAALSFSGLYHMSYGLVEAFRIFRVPYLNLLNNKGKKFQIFAEIGAVAAVSTVFALAGFYYPIEIPRKAEYLSFFSKFLPSSFTE